MSTIHLTQRWRHQGGTHALPDPDLVHPELVAPETPAARAGRYAAGVVRISLGWIFLWAFLDKLFGLGFATERDASWLNGGSPTDGFLSFATQGPFADAFQSLAGHTAVDVLFMAGLLGVGLTLVTGIGVRIGAISAAVMVVLMWAAALWPENNPFMDDHLVYAGVLVMLALTDAGRTLGLGRMWERVPLVRRHPWLR